jgi:hypothetical protein
MLQLGKYNSLKVIDKNKDNFILEFGMELPINEGVEINIGDNVEVFVYNDIEKGIKATTKRPFAQVGELALLQVVDTNDMGAFLDIGLDKDVLLLRNKMEYEVATGDEVLVAIRLDNKKRLSATMFISDYLEVKQDSTLGKSEKGIIYRVNPEMGVFIAIDGIYHGFVHKNKLDKNYKVGDEIEGRVVNIRPDGKIELALREKAVEAMDGDSAVIYSYMEKNGGALGINDKSEPEEIKEKLGLSKKAFKRALGKLYKEKKVEKKGNDFFILKENYKN